MAKTSLDWETVSPLPPAIDLASVTFGSGGFVLTDSGGFLATSSNGTGWTRLVGPGQPREVVFEEGQFVVVAWLGSDGVIYTSPDGEVWEQRASSLGELPALAYGNGVFVAPNGGGVLVSGDGHSWEVRDFSGDPMLQDVVFGGGRFVVVGPEDATSSRLGISPNGFDWTTVTPPGTNLLRSIGYGNGLYVASGDNGAVLTSTDTLNWTLHGPITQHTTSTPIIRSIAYGNGVFVAGGAANRMFYSTNGSNWLGACIVCEPAFFLDFKPIRSVAFGNGRFIAVANVNTVYTSTNGSDWAVVRAEEDLHGVAHADGTFVAVGFNSTVWVSEDGGRKWAWAFGGKDAGLPRLFSVTFGNDRFVAVGGIGPYAAISADGHEWTPYIPPHLPHLESFRSVTFGEGLFVAAGDLEIFLDVTEPRIATSTTGTNWAHQTFTSHASARSFLGAGYGDGRFVVVGTGGLIHSSPDGTNWSVPQFSGTTSTLRSVTYFNGQFIVGGDGGLIITSPDGTNWAAAAPTSFRNRGLGAGSGVVAIGDLLSEGRLHHSADGVAWPGSSIVFPEALNAVTYGEGRWVAVGNGGFIVRSDSDEVRFRDPRFRESGFEALIDVQAAHTYRIEVSTNAIDWEMLRTFTPSESNFLMEDPGAFTVSNRLYRVVSP